MSLPSRAVWIISIHALLAESDWKPSAELPPILAFLSTLSLRRATYRQQIGMDAQAFLSTLSLRRATYCFCCMACRMFISIHALLAESDAVPEMRPNGQKYFYPRSPCGERRILSPRPSKSSVFLSTLSLRRATMQNARASRWTKFLSTLSLRRATGRDARQRHFAGISIHALLAESDLFRSRCFASQHLFLSTLSLRRATRQIPFRCPAIRPISIHALLAESDATKTWASSVTPYFYPRSPCGERHLF